MKLHNYSSFLIIMVSLMSIQLTQADGSVARSTEARCIVGESALEDLKKARESLQQKEKDLAARDIELQNRERALQEVYKKTQQIQEEIIVFQENQKKVQNEKVGKLVETFLTMSPKSAAKVISTLDEELAVSALERMDSQPLAKIFNAMDPTKASQLSQRLSGLAQRSPAKQAELKKGGASNG